MLLLPSSLNREGCAYCDDDPKRTACHRSSGTHSRTILAEIADTTPMAGCTTCRHARRRDPRQEPDALTRTSGSVGTITMSVEYYLDLRDQQPGSVSVPATPNVKAFPPRPATRTRSVAHNVDDSLPRRKFVRCNLPEFPAPSIGRHPEKAR